MRCRLGSLRAAVLLASAMGEGALAAKLDLRKAYRHLVMAVADLQLLFVFFDGVHYCDTAMAFGAATAPAEFSDLIDVLWRRVVYEIQSPALETFYDDCLLLGYESARPLPPLPYRSHWPQGMRAGESLLAPIEGQFRRMIEVIESHGFEIAHDKTIWPTNQIVFLGCLYDPVRMLVGLSADKQQRSWRQRWPRAS
jgi:hypothetical protein